eukprot:gene3526-3862_t
MQGSVLLVLTLAWLAYMGEAWVASSASRSLTGKLLRSRTISSLRAAADEKVATPTTAGKTEGRQRQTSVNIVNNQGEEEFCLLDKESGEIIYLTKEEKERVFLDAVQSYYFSGRNVLTDKQFDRLREDLSWEGSVLVTLNRNETHFLNAMQAYAKGKPVMSDVEFDELKESLKESGSKIAVTKEPKCYVDTGVCKVNWSKDGLRTSSLYFPAGLIASTVFLGLFYEVPLIREYLNPLLLLLVGAIPISNISKRVTEELFFKDPLVAYGPCPSCGVENRVFFGDVLGVEGDHDESSIKCTNCKTSMTIKRSTLRVSTLMPKGKAPPPRAAVADE